MSVNKKCERCNALYFRPKRISEAQWQRRKFCSKTCSATKINIPVSELALMYKSGLSGADISKAVGISDTHARRLIKSYGVKMRSNGEPQRIAFSKPDVKRRLSEATKGRRHSKETKEKLASVFGDRHPLWKGGVTKLSSGYLVYTRSKQNGEIANKTIHQVVAKRKYGRWAKNGEHIHHVDGNKLNNNPDNLLLMSASAHAKLHQFQRSK